MLRESHRLEIEPTTCKPQVQRPTAEPPRNTEDKSCQPKENRNKLFTCHQKKSPNWPEGSNATSFTMALHFENNDELYKLGLNAIFHAMLKLYASKTLSLVFKAHQHDFFHWKLRQKNFLRSYSPSLHFRQVVVHLNKTLIVKAKRTASILSDLNDRRARIDRLQLNA